ncbi:MAG: hypothetical protein ABIH24_06515 [Verrucomicrobiota bacterium]
MNAQNDYFYDLIRHPSSVIRHPSAVSRQPSAVSRQPSAVSRQPILIGLAFPIVKPFSIGHPISVNPARLTRC